MVIKEWLAADRCFNALHACSPIFERNRHDSFSDHTGVMCPSSQLLSKIASLAETDCNRYGKLLQSSICTCPIFEAGRRVGRIHYIVIKY